MIFLVAWGHRGHRSAQRWRIFACTLTRPMRRTPGIDFGPPASSHWREIIPFCELLTHSESRVMVPWRVVQPVPIILRAPIPWIVLSKASVGMPLTALSELP